jgi:Dyp-type peroxidase family
MALPILTAPLTWKSTDPNVVALLDDLQANILKGHGRNHTIHLLLQFDPAKQVPIKAALHQLSGQLKTAKQQLLEAEDFKTSKKDGGTVRCFLMTFAGYQALGVAAKAPPTPAGSAFQAGMKARTAILKDPASATWDSPFNLNIHAMLLLADEDTERLNAERESVVASLEAVGVKVLGEEHGDQQHNSRGDGVEHFGYVDGRSQPLLLTEDVDHEKALTDGTSMWDPAFPADQVLVTNAGVLLGSFFVFRKLEQNVFAFKRKEEDLSTALGLTGEDRELAGAMMVGRFEDGTPVVLRKEAGIGGSVPNNFNYNDDTTGVKCPFHAHIRKTNPRGSGGAEPQPVERGHIMARRGITYGEREEGMGDRPEEKVGLLFMSYQKSLENQFEFTQQTWANNPGFPIVPPPPPGIDPVIGQGVNPPGTQQTPQHWGDPATAKTPSNFAGFVKMKGGEYFFAPVISTLRTL